MLRLMAHILILRPFVRLFCGLTVIGKDHLPQSGRYLIIANHNSHLDVCVLFCLIPLRDIRRTHAVADKAYFSRNRLVFRIVRFLFEPVFIARGPHGKTEDPLEELGSLIEKGHNIIVFPEGTRGQPGELQRFKSGVGRLASRHPDLPIVPVYLSGPERAFPKASSVLLPFWNHVIIGPPRTCGGTHRDITRQLEQALVELSRSESARRHKRYAKKVHHARSVAFLGIDGSGKSTISRMTAAELSRAHQVSLIGDRLEFFEEGTKKSLQPFIAEGMRRAIGGYAKQAGSLTRYKLPKLTELMFRNHLHHELERWYVADYVVLDGSPLLNMVAWAALFRQEAFDDDTCLTAIAILTGNDAKITRNDPIYRQFPELRYLRNLRLNRLIVPDAVVFIDVTPGTACSRIDRRGERKQVHETPEKLAELRRAYANVCDIIKRRLNLPVATIDGEDTPESVAANAMAFVLQPLTEE